MVFQDNWVIILECWNLESKTINLLACPDFREAKLAILEYWDTAHLPDRQGK